MKYCIPYIILLSAVSFFLGCSFLDDDLTRPDFTLYPRENGVDYLEIIAIGDCGTGGTGQIATSLMMKNYAENIPIDFVLYLGDNCYPAGFSSIYDGKWQTCFEDIYNYPELDIPFYAILGNHDYAGNEDCQLEYSATFDTNFTMSP